MVDKNWQKVRAVFDGALHRQPEERHKFIHNSCDGDQTLIAEVESLLSSLASADSFMETPAIAQVAGMVEAATNQLQPGMSFGHYEIIRLISKGGMGEVYLATDKKLDRQVAIKILNEKYNRDEANLHRFIREAKAASSLNHPNILVIHEIGEAGETHYIVSEFINGKTLRELGQEKPLPLSKLLDILLQIANALCTAHEAHLVHRDIKPENIMIRPDGLVKVLDFGLAKLVEQKNKAILGREKATLNQIESGKGAILGTVNYMSPEQARGERVDERTDVFSFGTLVYEMIAGRTPFAGSSIPETLSNLITAEPQPLTRFAESVPGELQRIVAKLLRKNKGARYQAMKDVLTDLKDLRENLSLVEKPERSATSGERVTEDLPATTGDTKLPTAATRQGFSQTVSRHKPYFLLAGGIILLSSLFGLGFIWFGEGVQNRAKQAKLTRLMTNGKVTNATVSPDGNYLVFAQKEGVGESLWRRQISTGSQMQILPPQDVAFIGLTVAPDNNQIYYSVFSQNEAVQTLSRVALSGGAPEKIPDIDSDVSVSFSPDGKRFAFTAVKASLQETYLKIADADGTNQKTLSKTKGDERMFQIFKANPVAWSPDGETIACVVQETDENGLFHRILLVNPQDGSEQPLSKKRWNTVEHIAWKDAKNLAVIDSEPNSPISYIWEIARKTGEIRQLTNDFNDYLWLSSAGGNLFTVQKNVSSSLHVADFADHTKTLQAKHLFGEAGGINNVEWSRDGKIYYNSWASGKNEIWQINPDGTNPQQVTTNAHLAFEFAVSPLDNTLVFSALQKGRMSLFVANSDGQHIRQLTDGTHDFLPNFSPDGKTIVFQRASVLPTLWRVPLAGDQPSVQLTGYHASHPAISPDGQKIAYHFVDYVGKNSHWKLGLINSETHKLLNKLDFPVPILERKTVWRPNTNLLTMIFNNGANVGILLLSATDGKFKTIENIAVGKVTSFAWSPDGSRFAFSKNSETTDVVSLKDF